MASLAPVDVGGAPVDAVAGLAAGDYVLQNVAGREIQYAIAATDPSGANVGWHVLEPLASILVTVTAGEGLWMRTGDGRPSQAAISGA